MEIESVRRGIRSAGLMTRIFRCPQFLIKHWTWCSISQAAHYRPIQFITKPNRPNSAAPLFLYQHSHNQHPHTSHLVFYFNIISLQPPSNHPATPQSFVWILEKQSHKETHKQRPTKNMSLSYRCSTKQWAEIHRWRKQGGIEMQRWRRESKTEAATVCRCCVRLPASRVRV